MFIDRGCFERGCACYKPLLDEDYVAIPSGEWRGIKDEELEKWNPEIRSIIRLFEARLKERNTV